VRHATDAGVNAWTGTSDSLPPGYADLVISVNVVEHTRDPRTFLASLRRAVAAGGQIVLICPDGARPSVELLIVDHLHSFTASHLASLVSTSGAAVAEWSAAPRQLGAFQMVVANVDSTEHLGLAPHDPAMLRTARRAYLGAWAMLDASLKQRLPSDVVCFGAGEAAGLLRAYAPGAWSRVRACTTDEPGVGTFGRLPRVPLNTVAADTTILIGVRPQDQPTVADRLRPQFKNVVTWYDLVPSDV
jgi:hypothetical protein